jgi:hypothetical protein
LENVTVVVLIDHPGELDAVRLIVTTDVRLEKGTGVREVYLQARRGDLPVNTQSTPS